MSKLWEDLKENMKEWSSSAVEKAEEMSRIAMAKTEEMTRISKIKFEIHQLQREMDRKYEALGKLAYTHTKEDHMASFSGNTDFFEIVNRVDEIKDEIKEKQEEIEKIKQDYDIDDDEIISVSSNVSPESNIIIEDVSEENSDDITDENIESENLDSNK
ncbi:MAG: hypothetical protein HN674_04420 [Candidatus Marinimicrobia bacterium]|jgi:DNA-binding protein YbaB|nr:hypothetical protein [Candidatus Neomarinimicrobiota bacterium]MBT7822361.1 hypothetical protein [Candidatus Neomarinimicrobiota bacterium]